MSDLAPHQQRVVEEADQLAYRLDKLRTFLDTKVFYGLPEDERVRLCRQSEVMTEYGRILAERIAAFS